MTVESADLTMLPKTTVELEDEAAAKKVIRLMDALEDNDDVQDVYANFDVPERVLETVEGWARTAAASTRRHSGRSRCRWRVARPSVALASQTS